MKYVFLCSPDHTAKRQISDPNGALALHNSLSRLYYPRNVDDASIRGVAEQFAEWSVHVPRSGEGPQVHTTVREYLQMLTAEHLPANFKSVLARISKTPKEPAAQEALKHFDISRFCEFRAALGALRVPSIERAQVVPPNSSFDQMKVDLLVYEPGKDDAKPFQVKAMKGKPGRVSALIPTIREVWKMSFSELVRVFPRLSGL